MVVYLANSKGIKIDREAEITSARNRLDQLGMAYRGAVSDGLIIDCVFRSRQLANAFVDTLNAADLSKKCGEGHDPSWRPGPLEPPRAPSNP